MKEKSKRSRSPAWVREITNLLQMWAAKQERDIAIAGSATKGRSQRYWFRVSSTVPTKAQIAKWRKETDIDIVT